MNKRSIRYRKPEWNNWVYEKIDESQVEERVAYLKSLGYLVEY